MGFNENSAIIQQLIETLIRRSDPVSQGACCILRRSKNARQATRRSHLPCAGCRAFVQSRRFNNPHTASVIPQQASAPYHSLSSNFSYQSNPLHQKCGRAIHSHFYLTINMTPTHTFDGPRADDWAALVWVLVGSPAKLSHTVPCRCSAQSGGRLTTIHGLGHSLRNFWLAGGGSHRPPPPIPGILYTETISVSFCSWVRVGILGMSWAFLGK